MKNNTLSRKEFYLLIGWIIGIVVVALIERYYSNDAKIVLNKLEVKDFQERKMEVRGEVVERKRINLEH